jgi:hypothetical protein
MLALEETKFMQSHPPRWPKHSSMILGQFKLFGAEIVQRQMNRRCKQPRYRSVTEGLGWH